MSAAVEKLTAPATAQQVLPSHLNGVDGLRGVAALSILIYHCFTISYAPELRPFHHINLLRPLHDGWAGVDLFLVLSGFCLFWPYARNPERKMHFGDFMRRRVRRIVPAYYASLLFVPLAYLFSVHVLHLSVQPTDYSAFPRGIFDIVLHLLMLHSLFSSTIQSWNGVSWSLGLEWTWYLIFPLAVWLFRRAGAQTALLWMAVITLAYRSALWLHFGPASYFPPRELHYVFSLTVFVAGVLFEFGAGMYAAWWLANRAITQRMVTAALVLVPVLLIIAHAATPIDSFLPVRGFLYASAFALLLIIVIAPTKNFVQNIVAGKFLRSVGEYSYSLYLFHLVFVSAVTNTLRQHGILGAKTFFLSLLFTPFILLFAKGAFLAVEKPFMSAPTRRQYEMADPKNQSAV